MDLARHILDFSRTLLDVEKSLFPNRTCEYMFQLSQLFSKFYSADGCSVGDATTPDGAKSEELKISRLGLLVVAVNCLKVGFDLIGLKTVDVM